MVPSTKNFQFSSSVEYTFLLFSKSNKTRRSLFRKSCPRASASTGAANLQRIKEAYPRGMITASRDILSTAARKNRILQPYLAIAPLFFLLCRDEDEKSPPHRISQLDICACIHHLPRLRVIAIPFPSRIYSDWFSLAVLFTTISKNSPLIYQFFVRAKMYISRAIERNRTFIFRKKNF